MSKIVVSFAWLVRCTKLISAGTWVQDCSCARVSPRSCCRSSPYARNNGAYQFVVRVVAVAVLTLTVRH